MVWFAVKENFGALHIYRFASTRVNWFLDAGAWLRVILGSDQAKHLKPNKNIRNYSFELSVINRSFNSAYDGKEPSKPINSISW
jgi:hypothetical protein